MPGTEYGVPVAWDSFAGTTVLMPQAQGPKGEHRKKSLPQNSGRKEYCHSSGHLQHEDFKQKSKADTCHLDTKDVSPKPQSHTDPYCPNSQN